MPGPHPCGRTDLPGLGRGAGHIDSILACRPRPAEIMLVNDNVEAARPAWVSRYPIFAIDYSGNRGPSYARNTGARFRSGRPIDWLYFTDTGCQRDPGFFAELVDSSMAMPRTTVAIAAPVVGIIDSGAGSLINRYMTEEAILNPPQDALGPQAIITANAAVSAAAFHATTGFDPTYPFAAGEDLDLGVRLRRLGSIGWAHGAVVFHRFVESDDDFRRRFVRYGAGTAHLEHTLALPALRVHPIVARDPMLQHLANIQVQAMQTGYDLHLRRLETPNTK
ncbi:MAG: glycosyltransferase [Phycisphaerae bacterium]|nr:glycosyltransferase [Phycisphaerae bacterium]